MLLVVYDVLLVVLFCVVESSKRLTLSSFVSRLSKLFVGFGGFPCESAVLTLGLLSEQDFERTVFVVTTDESLKSIVEFESLNLNSLSFFLSLYLLAPRPLLRPERLLLRWLLNFKVNS